MNFTREIVLIPPRNHSLQFIVDNLKEAEGSQQALSQKAKEFYLIYL